MSCQVTRYIQYIPSAVAMRCSSIAFTTETKHYWGQWFKLKGFSICARTGHLACVLHSFLLSVAVFLHDDMSVRLSVALIKKKWKSIVPIIPVGSGCESANGSASPFWHVQHKPQCHSGHLPIPSAYPSLFPSPPSPLSLSHTESLLLIIHLPTSLSERISLYRFLL